jgi:hypothetical protein
MESARKRNRTRGTRATRKRTAAALRSDIRTVATVAGERVSLIENPNRAKHGAAKLDNSPRFTPRQYAPGAPDAQRHYMPTLETSWARIPSLGTHLSKRPLKGTSKG